MYEMKQVRRREIMDNIAFNDYEKSDSLDRILLLSENYHKENEYYEDYFIVSRKLHGEANNDNPEENGSQSILTRQQLFILFSVYYSALCSSSFYSLLAPFFPVEAKHKQATQSEIGLIFGVYQAVIFITSPIYGRYMTKIGPKFLYVSGIGVTSSCAILFGCLEWCPPGRIYVGMCFLVRGFEALATAATTTSSLAIAADAFPHRIASVMGGLEAFNSIGYMLGPPLGGIIYQYGGFHLPFFLTGGLFMLGGIASFIFIPTIKGKPKTSRISWFALLKIPMVLLIAFGVIVAQGAIGFMNVGLSSHLNIFITSPAAIGGLFLVPSLSILILAPLGGYICDRNRSYGRYIMFTGCMIGGIGTTGLGPSPIYHFFLPERSLWVVAVALAVAGIGMSCLVVTYQEIVTAAMANGYENNIETQALISGLYNSFNSLGAFLGPTTAGFLLQTIGFDWAATFFGMGVFLAGFNVLVYTVWEKVLKPRLKGRPIHDNDTEIDTEIESDSTQIERDTVAIIRE